MADGPLVTAVLERLFVQGFNCPNIPRLTAFIQAACESRGTPIDPGPFSKECRRFMDIAVPAISPDGATASSTEGASHRWLAVHEAGHALVGVKAGFFVKGVRFYNPEGFPGETGFDDDDWATCTDEDLMRRHIMIDVAGNIAEILEPADREPEGRLSMLYDDLTPGMRPTDFIIADMKAKHLAFILHERAGNPPVNDPLWAARRVILEQAERDADEVLRSNRGVLRTLAIYLQSGPMTGTAVRSIVEAL